MDEWGDRNGVHASGSPWVVSSSQPDWCPAHSCKGPADVIANSFSDCSADDASKYLA